MGFFQTWWARVRHGRSKHAGFTRFRADGKEFLLDQATLNYLTSKAPAPNRQSLDAVLFQTRRVRLFQGGSESGQPMTSEVLFETDNGEEISKLRTRLRILEGPYGHCMCYGGPTIELVDAEGRRLAVISVHHGRSVRWDAWRDDAGLADGRSLLEWMAELGAPEPLQSYEEETRRREAREAARDRWFAAMPPCLSRFMSTSRHSPIFVAFEGQGRAKEPKKAVDPQSKPRALHAKDLSEQLHALRETYPDGSDCARVLFAWFGSGAGPWNGYPTYERAAEELLMELPLSDMLRALESPQVSDEHLEGAARFFAGPRLTTGRASEAPCLPTGLKQRLLEHAMRSSDPEKRSRAQAAFDC